MNKTFYYWGALSFFVIFSVPFLAHADEQLDNYLTYITANSSLVAQMEPSVNLAVSLSRAEAAVLVEQTLIAVNSAFNIDLSGYPNPFSDVDPASDYSPSVKRLAYYLGGDDVTVVTKERQNFKPLVHVTRAEFVKMVLQGFNLDLADAASLSSFSDADQLVGHWAEKYFKTAVYHGIIVGNGGYLYPFATLTMEEGLNILKRIYFGINGQYFHDANGYEDLSAIHFSDLLFRRIGSEYEPMAYITDAVPIDIQGINHVLETDEDGNPRLHLTVSSSIDISNNADDYYWWASNDGYFKKDTDNFNQVYFYPATGNAPTNYRITVNGGDNIGYIDSHTITLAGDIFTTPSEAVVPTAEVDFTGIVTSSAPSMVVAGRSNSISLSGTAVNKDNLSFGIEQVTVTMVVSGDTPFEQLLFRGRPVDDKIQFYVPDQPNLYGQDIEIRLELHTQEINAQQVLPVKYVPVFLVRGRVYNADYDHPVTFVLIDGHPVFLDEHDEFYYEIISEQEPAPVRIYANSNSETNEFESVRVSLTYDVPAQYTALFGQNMVSTVESDQDEDGVDDADDNCPTIYNPDQSPVCTYQGNINISQTTQGSYVRLALTRLIPGSIVTVTSDDGVYTYTFTVPDSGRLFPEVRAGATGTLHITITDGDGNPVDQQTIALDVVAATDRVTNQRTTPGNQATTTSFTRPAGYSGAVVVRYTAQPGESSAIGTLTSLPATGDSLAGGTVSYTGTATSTTDNGLAIGAVYYYRTYPYKAVYVSDGQGGQVLDHYQFGPGVTSSARTDLTGTLATDLTLNNDSIHPYRLTYESMKGVKSAVDF